MVISTCLVIACIIINNMSITVKYFAGLRDLLGRSEDILTIEEGITVSDLWLQVSCKHKSLPVNIMTAVNREYVRPDARVNDGDEVAFFPPVTGG